MDDILSLITEGRVQNMPDRNKLISSWKHDRLAVKRHQGRSGMQSYSLELLAAIYPLKKTNFSLQSVFHWSPVTGEGKHVPTTPLMIARADIDHS